MHNRPSWHRHSYPDASNPYMALFKIERVSLLPDLFEPRQKLLTTPDSVFRQLVQLFRHRCHHGLIEGGGHSGQPTGRGVGRMTTPDQGGEAYNLLRWIQTLQQDLFAAHKDAEVTRLVPRLDQLLQNRSKDAGKVFWTGGSPGESLQCRQPNGILPRLLVAAEKVQRFQSN